jgi:hypothetical protein
MAKIVGAYTTSHSPFCYMPAERWNDVRGKRSLREDVPFEDLETAKVKEARIAKAFATMRERVAEDRPDVLVIFGDDQLECFDFNNYPTFCVYLGDEFHGALSASDLQYNADGSRPKSEQHQMKGHSGLATGILTGLLKRDFDPGWAMDMPKPDKGIGHAFMRPAETFTDLSVPVVPILVNCYFAPQATAKRCYALGKAVRAAIEEYPEDLRVVVIGSGGMWHTPGAKDAWLDEEFDQELLTFMAAGDARGMAEHFDAYNVPDGDLSQPVGQAARTATGLPASVGPQGGTRETCNWIATAGVMDGTRATIVDYVPVYSSPCGEAFAYWEGE